MATTNDEIGLMEGAEALPRSNGELVFEAPWEGRAFGIAVALNEQSVYPWRSFRDALVDHIAEDEAASRLTAFSGRWLAPHDTLLQSPDVRNTDHLAVRAAEY